MAEPIDYGAFDLPQISQMMFYPQRMWSPTPAGASDHMVDVDTGVFISARFYPRDKASPSILFFHGNGEIACQYDDIAPYYHEAGANLFAADFRGYGKSTGTPSFSGMVSDARKVYEYFRELLASEGYSGPRFVKGRSLGCHSAVEVAARYGDELNGFVSESGSAAADRMASRWGLDLTSPAMQETLRLHTEKVASITVPFLVIHGEWDDLVPVETATALYDSVGSTDKTMELIPGAGHNDLLWAGMKQYFDAMAAFLSGHAGAR